MFNENDVLRTTLVLTLLLSGLALIWRVQVSLGVLLGGIMSTLAFRLMIIDGTRLLQSAGRGSVDPKGAYRSSFKSFAKRCLLYATVLIIGIQSPYLSFFATCAGLLMPRLAILYHYLYGRTKRGS
jgi:hypothetical protein